MTSPETLQGHLAERLDADADRPALTFFDRSGAVEWITFGALLTSGAGAASSLGAAGLAAGEPCVIVAGNDLATIDALLGVLMMGAVPLLMAPPAIQGANSSLPAILTGIVDRVAPTVVVAADRKGADFEALSAARPGVRFLVGPEDLPASTGDPSVMAARTGDQVAAMQLTSGTTGFPRICVWRQRNVIAAFDGMASAMDVGRDDRFVNWTPLYHDMGLINNFLMCVTRGIPLVMLSPFDFVKDPSIWMRAVSATGATTSWSPNFGFAITAQRVTDARLDGVRLDHVRGLWNAAEKIHLPTMEAFADRFEPYGLDRAALRTNFGCAENIGGATFTRAGEPFRSESVDAGALYERQVAVSADGTGPSLTFVGCGAPHSGITLYIVDEDGNILPDGHVGELAMRTSSRMDRYLDDPEATAAAVDGDVLKTGDLGYVRNGEFFWTGRLRERITVRGRKIDPSDFEAVLLDVPGLRPGAFTVFGVDDDEVGTQRVVVVAEVRPDGEHDAVVATTQRATFDQLGVAVDDMVLVEPGTLAKTSSGKRRHRHFRDAYLRGELDGRRVSDG